MRHAPITTALLAAALSLNAAAQSASASLSGGDTVRQGEQLLLNFEFADVSPRAFAVPELVGLAVVGGPNRRSRVSISGGQRRSATALSYYVVAEQPGLAYVPAVPVVTHAGDTLRTDALQVFVTADPAYVPLGEPAPARPAKRRPPTIKM